jgi:uncharacterized protein (TIGR00730 family)
MRYNNQILNKGNKRMKSICVYTGASLSIPEEFHAAAKDVGRIIAATGYKLIYGGGNTGLMGTVSSSVMDNGGQVLGITTKQLAEIEVINTKISEVRVVENMHIRKQNMYENSDSFLILPGGFGTLDEFFEIITWKQLEIHSHPVIIFNYKGYWDPLKTLFESMKKNGFIKDKHIDMVAFVNDSNELLALLQNLKVA